jgi:hypothetical protein
MGVNILPHDLFDGYLGTADIPHQVGYHPRGANHADGMVPGERLGDSDFASFVFVGIRLAASGKRTSTGRY